MSELIVGVDESEGAAAALRWAVREADLHRWTVTAVLAWGFIDQNYTTSDPDLDDDPLNALTEMIVAAVGDKSATAINRRFVRELPARALLEESRGSKLLVIGARGLGGFRELLLGSVSQHCLHHATSPVAIVRGRTEVPPDGDERIVVAVDGSENSQRAFRWALDEARLRQAKVALVNAWQEPYVGGYPYTAKAFEPAQPERTSHRILEAALAAEDVTGIPAPVESISAPGGAAEAILEASEGANLVVMGSRGLGGFKGMLLGSVAAQVTHHVQCPIVVVPAE